MISEEIKLQLMNAGLSKQQANSSTADFVVNFLMDDNDKNLIQEANLQVEAMRNIVADLRQEYLVLKQKIDTVAGFLTDIAKAQEEHGVLSDDKAKNAAVLYSAILKMNERAGARGKDSVENAGYVTYAYLGGQARRDIHYDKPQYGDD